MPADSFSISYLGVDGLVCWDGVSQDTAAVQDKRAAFPLLLKPALEAAPSMMLAEDLCPLHLSLPYTQASSIFRLSKCSLTQGPDSIVWR